MSNDVIITVKVRNDGSFDPIKTALKGVSTAAADAGKALNSIIGGASGPVASAAAGLGTLAANTAATGAASTAASGGMNILSGAVGVLASVVPIALGAFLGLAPALLAAGGAAGAAATALAGLGVALAVLKIGFGGIGAALTAHGKAVGGGGKAATDSAEQHYQAAKRIKDAARAVVDAQKSVVDAQKAVVKAKDNEKDAAEDVNRARADEIDRIRELDLALRGQKVSQAEAAQALVEAKEKARRADIAGSEWEKAEARNAVARAQVQYDEVSEKLGDLTTEKQRADKQGVEGSDKVQSALDKQRDAHDAVLSAQDRLLSANAAVTRAQENLADAHHKVATAAAGGAGGINAFADAMNKLSPNAQKLVYALLAIEKRFEAIKRRVQDRLLAGFDVAVTQLADKWLPHLDDILGTMADHLNLFGKNLMTALGDSTFIKNIQRASGEFGKFIDKISDATGKIIDAFGRIAGHSGPVLQKIGDLIVRIAAKFDDWIKAADKSGALDTFMKNAADTLQDIFDIGGLVFSIIGDIIQILFPGSQAASNSVFDKLKAALQKVSDWLGDPKNQKKVQEFIAKVEDFIKWLIVVGIPAVANFGRKIGDMANSAINAGRKLADMWHAFTSSANNAFNWIEDRFSTVLNWISKNAHAIGNGLGNMWDGMKNGFRNALNWVIGKWNNLSFTIGGGSFLGATIPSARFDTPNIQYLARGGIAGGMAVVGERGRELVRLPQGSTVIPHGQSESMLAQGSGGGHLTLGFDPGSGNRLETILIEMIQNYVKTRGGNAQVALGRVGAR